jgi:catechol 2,3-dioxygenase-like lactoylglutathione lyase family enzyme
MGTELSVPSPSLSILETVLYAHDLVAIEDFYRRVLGFEPFAAVPGRHVFYRCGEQMLLIFNPEATRHPPKPGALPVPPHGMEGQGHVCFRVSADQLDMWRTKLPGLGIDIEADFEWPKGGSSIYFRDPAGNCLELAEARIWGIS